MQVRSISVILSAVLALGTVMLASVASPHMVSAAAPAGTTTPQPTPSHGPAGTIKITERGKGVDGYWQSVDETGCIYDMVAVAGNEWFVIEHPGSPIDFTGAMVSISSYDICQQT